MEGGALHDRFIRSHPAPFEVRQLGLCPGQPQSRLALHIQVSRPTWPVSSACCAPLTFPSWATCWGSVILATTSEQHFQAAFHIPAYGKRPPREPSLDHLGSAGEVCDASQPATYDQRASARSCTAFPCEVSNVGPGSSSAAMLISAGRRPWRPSGQSWSFPRWTQHRLPDQRRAEYDRMRSLCVLGGRRRRRRLR
jgi:hypothetical protein